MFLVAALILLLCGPWFPDQHTVGLVLLIPAAIELGWYTFVISLFFNNR